MLPKDMNLLHVIWVVTISLRCVQAGTDGSFTVCLRLKISNFPEQGAEDDYYDVVALEDRDEL